MNLLSRLESTALLATQGEWRIKTLARDHNRVDGIYGPERYEDYGMGPERADVRIVETDQGHYPPRMHDAEHIALACPENVLKLVAVAKAAERALITLMPGNILTETERGVLQNALAALETHD